MRTFSICNYFSVGTVLLSCTIRCIRVHADPEPSPDVCDSDMNCANGGKCVLTHDGLRKCYCYVGYKGQLCLEDCDVRCNNHGQCVDVENGQDTCQCEFGFTGPLCEQALTCSSDDDCGNSQGRCFVSRDQTDSECKCNTGFMGEKCTETCMLQCKNGGYCIIKEDDAHLVCNCPSGFDGVECELLLNGVNTSNPGSAVTTEDIQEEKWKGWLISLIVISGLIAFVVTVYSVAAQTTRNDGRKQKAIHQLSTPTSSTGSTSAESIERTEVVGPFESEKVIV